MPTKTNAGRRETELRGSSRRSLTMSMNSYQKSPALSQKVVINSSQIVIEDGTEASEESKGNVENVVPNLPSNSSDNNNNKASKCQEPKKDACVTCTGELSKNKHRLLDGQTIIIRERHMAACSCAVNKV